MVNSELSSLVRTNRYPDSSKRGSLVAPVDRNLKDQLYYNGFLFSDFSLSGTDFKELSIWFPFSHKRLQPRAHLVPGDVGSNELILHFAIFEKQQVRDGPNAVVCRNSHILCGIDFADYRCIGHFLG
jgi:hypothetical protein